MRFWHWNERNGKKVKARRRAKLSQCHIFSHSLMQSMRLEYKRHTRTHSLMRLLSKSKTRTENCFREIFKNELRQDVFSFSFIFIFSLVYVYISSFGSDFVGNSFSLCCFLFVVIVVFLFPYLSLCL